MAYRIRAAAAQDVRAVVNIHRKMFPGFLMTLMGPGFLSGYYQSILDSSVGLLLVAENEAGDVIGFVSGFTSPSAFYGFFRKRKYRLALMSLFYVAFRPGLWARILENVSTVERVADAQSDSKSAELSSIAVLSTVEGRGCGKSLVERFVAECAAAGLPSIVLTTDAENNDRVNSFYEKLGFEKVLTFKRSQGRLMNMYRFTI
jgi:ribosomal protein S18 acetylase RimI-like enzyme